MEKPENTTTTGGINYTDGNFATALDSAVAASRQCLEALWAARQADFGDRYTGRKPTISFSS